MIDILARLLRIYDGVVTYRDSTSAAGNAFGTTVVCVPLAALPSYVGNPIKILDGGAAGQVRQISVDDGAGTLTVAAAFTDNAGNPQQIVAGIRFVILSGIGAGGPTPPPPPTPGVGLWMFGECAPDMVASTITVRCPNLAGLGDDLFNTEFFMQVLNNVNAPGAAPEPEVRQITDYVSGTGTFTVNAFSANVEAGDQVCIFHNLIWGPFVLINLIFDMVSAILRLQETYDSLTADGTEQTVYQNNNPLGVFDPRKIKIDMGNMAVGDTVVLRWYERISSGGALVQKDEMIFDDVQDPPLVNIELEPNRYGFRATLEQTAGVNRVFPWEYLYES